MNEIKSPMLTILKFKNKNGKAITIDYIWRVRKM